MCIARALGTGSTAAARGVLLSLLLLLLLLLVVFRSSCFSAILHVHVRIVLFDGRAWSDLRFLLPSLGFLLCLCLCLCFCCCSCLSLLFFLLSLPLLHVGSSLLLCCFGCVCSLLPSHVARGGGRHRGSGKKEQRGVGVKERIVCAHTIQQLLSELRSTCVARLARPRSLPLLWPSCQCSSRRARVSLARRAEEAARESAQRRLGQARRQRRSSSSGHRPQPAKRQERCLLSHSPETRQCWISMDASFFLSLSCWSAQRREWKGTRGKCSNEAPNSAASNQGRAEPRGRRLRHRAEMRGCQLRASAATKKP